jgi:type I restriction enzyme S subunit
MSWKKIKLGDLCIIEKGKTGILKAIPGEYPLVVTAEDRKSHNEYQFDDEAVIIPLVSGTGHGHASIKRLHFQKDKFALGSILCAVIPKDKSVLNAEYLFRFLNLNKERELVDRMKGMANVTLPIKEIAKIEIPLPSLKEQIEFVEKYGLLETDSDDIFSELNYQLNLIKQLRQSFLREAMQGKLVKSTNTKETGQKLLAKIKAEKAQLIADKKLKKEKELPPISEDEIPFIIPEHWTWCRLGEIANTFTGNSINEREKSIKYAKTTQGLDYIGTKDVKFYGKGINYNTGVKIPFNNDKFKTTKENSILMCIEGGSSGKKYAMTNKEICFGNKLLASEINSSLNPFFYYKYYQSQLFSNEYIDKSKGLRGGVSINQFREIIAPIPPLHEQEQIVAKLEELMAFCDGLEDSIKESQGYNEKLLQQVLREALQGEEV